MAHGQTDEETGKFVAMESCISPMEFLPIHSDYHVVFQIDPLKPDHREVLAKIKLPMGRRASVMHAMAHTQNHVVLIAEPMHLSLKNIFLGKGLTEGAVELGNGTIFQAV